MEEATEQVGLKCPHCKVEGAQYFRKEYSFDLCSSEELQMAACLICGERFAFFWAKPAGNSDTRTVPLSLKKGSRTCQSCGGPLSDGASGDNCLECKIATRRQLIRERNAATFNTCACGNLTRKPETACFACRVSAEKKAREAARVCKGYKQKRCGKPLSRANTTGLCGSCGCRKREDRKKEASAQCLTLS